MLSVELPLQAQPSTGALPPVEEPAGPAPAAPAGAAQPEAAPGAQPTAPAPAQPTAQPQPAPQQPPPPGYAYPPPGYAYPPPQEPPPPPPPEPEPTRYVSITMSPVHLFLPVFEAMFEVRVVDGFGVAVIGGYGQVSAEDQLGESHEFSALELGGQLVWYPLEAFKSLQLGAELLYIKVETQEQGDQATLTGVGEGLALGPLIGYKLVTSGGFTFLAQGGVQYVALRAEATDGSSTASEEQDRFIPLINLNLGWTF